MKNGRTLRVCQQLFPGVQAYTDPNGLRGQAQEDEGSLAEEARQERDQHCVGDNDRHPVHGEECAHLIHSEV